MKTTENKSKKSIKTPKSAWKSLKLGKFSTFRVYEYDGLKSVSIQEYKNRTSARSVAKMMRENDNAVTLTNEVVFRYR